MSKAEKLAKEMAEKLKELERVDPAAYRQIMRL
jgi:hypothetical protein